MSTWEIDVAHSRIGFAVRHLMISKVHGQFAKFTGTIDFDDAAPEQSKISATIDVASIDTHDEKRDGHLKSPDFLDGAKYPQITFVSTKIARDGENGFKLTGNLTIHGQTGEITLKVESLGRAKSPWGAEHAGFAATGSLDRKSFGLTWNQALETGGVLVGDKVEIALEIEAIEK